MKFMIGVDLEGVVCVVGEQNQPLNKANANYNLRQQAAANAV